MNNYEQKDMEVRAHKVAAGLDHIKGKSGFNI